VRTLSVIVALAAILALAACGGGVPAVVHGSVTTSLAASQLAFGGSAHCGLNLPAPGTSQILLKGDGVTVATAQPCPVRADKGTALPSCSVAFTFTGVPGGRHLYELVITNTSTGGCTAAVYLKPAQLSGPLTITC
jgi:hypothetical protein